MIDRIASLQYRFYDRMRHREAFRVAREPGTARDFEAMRGTHYCLVVTFKRSGEPVPTPVLCGVEDGKLYFRTERRIAKIKRIRNDPHVRVGACNWRGKPRGPLTEGRARLLDGAEAKHAYDVLRGSYTFGQRLYESALDRMPIDIVYVEVTPSEARSDVAENLYTDRDTALRATDLVGAEREEER